MSQNPRGSDPYDYNPDYNRLNEQYNQNGQYGQNTQYGQYGQSSYDQYSYDQYGQPMMVPVGFLQKTPEQLAGEKAAQTSMVLGIIGLVCVVALSWFTLGVPPMILGIIGIFKANEAERCGVAASAGRIMSWINVAVGIAFLVLYAGSLLIILMMALASSGSNSGLVDAVQILALF